MTDEPRRRRPRWLTRPVRIAIGVILVLVGLAGLVLPVIQGVLTLCVAALLLAPEFPPARRLVASAFRRWPNVRRRIPRRIRDLAKRDPS